MADATILDTLAAHIDHLLWLDVPHRPYATMTQDQRQGYRRVAYWVLAHSELERLQQMLAEIGETAQKDPQP
jgi:hypothetical protein